jgi:predicted aspartyl protease
MVRIRSYAIAIALAHANAAAQTPGDTGAVRFTAGNSALAIPFDLYDGLIVVHVGVNGSAPLSFILDTGASSTTLSVRLAPALGLNLQSVGKTSGGIGERPDAYLVTDPLVFELPGVAVSGPPVAAVPLEMTEQCIRSGSADTTYRAIDGILGESFLRKVVVEIDFDARTINVHAPTTYKYAGPGRSLPLEMSGGLIFVRGTVKPAGRPPIRARFLIDTGSETPLSATEAFTKRAGLLRSSARVTPAKECGIGGFSRSTHVVGTLQEVELGGLRVHNPTTVFNQRPSTPGYDVLLGNPILRQFKVVFDYPHRRMILEQK